MNEIPKVYQGFKDEWRLRQQQHIRTYLDGGSDFLPNALPEDVLKLSAFEVLSILSEKFGERLEWATNLTNTDLNNTELTEALQSPMRTAKDGSWLRHANMVGINVRTIGSFWNVVKYALTLPKTQNAIHFLPIWEPGVVSSLYGMASWNINPEFFSDELAAVLPHLNTVERQLKAVINLLHLLGKTVGMDVIPHTDRFSEIVLANPAYFEWLQREEYEIVQHRADLHEEVEELIMSFLEQYGASNPFDTYPDSRTVFFSDDYPEAQRNKILFGKPEQSSIRRNRRDALLRFLTKYGYEPVPATMAPPYRGLEVTQQFETDEAGQIWREYGITKPEPFSRVFGPLTRYKLYERLDDNRDWAIDFERPRVAVWQYVAQRYGEVQQRYGFDFMRGDMSHVQMRASGVPPQPDAYYDILEAVKRYVRQQVSYFGYFAETFLAARNVMGYGDEIDHLEAADCDTTLGDLQSVPVNSADFLQRFRLYLDILQTRAFAPNFTIITADKDDPRFDKFYLTGNELRLFVAFFVTDMPSYMGLGFRVRDVHYEPAPNEHYTKLYVFQIGKGEKATNGDYQWGKNGSLYHRLLRLQHYAEAIWETVAEKPVRWLLSPDATGENKLLAWTQQDAPTHVFVAYADTQNALPQAAIPALRGQNNQQNNRLVFEFSTLTVTPSDDLVLTFNGKNYPLQAGLKAGECRVYRVE